MELGTFFFMGFQMCRWLLVTSVDNTFWFAEMNPTLQKCSVSFKARRKCLSSFVWLCSVCAGVLQTGLMLTKEGVKILNFKCQFGDPQCQVSGTHWKIKDVPFFSSYCCSLFIGKDLDVNTLNNV